MFSVFERDRLTPRQKQDDDGIFVMILEIIKFLFFLKMNMRLTCACPPWTPAASCLHNDAGPGLVAQEGTDIVLVFRGDNRIGKVTTVLPPQQTIIRQRGRAGDSRGKGVGVG